MAKRKSTKQLLAVVPAQNVVPNGGKANRNRRRRQRKAAAKQATRNGMTVPRSNPRVPFTREGANFLRGALDPFSDVSLRSVGVPDTFAGDTLKHCNTMEITVTPDAQGNIAFAVIPSASNPLIMLEGIYKGVTVPQFDATSFLQVGTNTVDINAASVFSGATFYPALYWPTWAITSAGNLPGTSAPQGLGQNGYGPYGYKSQRVVSQGLEWRYTGTELNDQGVCTAAICDGYILDGYIEKPANPTGVLTAAAVDFLTRSDVINVAVTPQSQSDLSNQPRYVQQTLHTSEGSGGMIVLVSAEEGYVLKTTNPRTVLIDGGVKASDFGVAGAPAIAGYGVDNSTPVKDVAGPLLPWQNLRPVGVKFTGLNPSTCTITLKLKQRVEATVNTYSAFQQFTDKSPPEDQKAIDMVADIQKTLPVMVPVTMNGFGDWWRKIMGSISGVGKIIGGMRLPFVSQIAGGVGDIADILGSFASL